MKMFGVVFIVLGVILIVSSNAVLGTSAQGFDSTATHYRSLTPHSPIWIVGDAQLDPAHGVTGGSGTASDPYLIQSYEIDGNSSIGIYLKNTTKYVKIVDCEIYNSSAAIRIENAQNVTVESVYSHDNDYGVFIYNGTTNSSVQHSTLEQNIYGVYIKVSSSSPGLVSNISVDSNNINNSTEHGILVEGYGYVERVNITGNKIMNTTSYGIYVYWSQDNFIAYNTIIDSGKYGIYIYYRVGNTIITSNWVENSGSYGIFVSNYCYDNLIYNNSFYYNHGSGDTYNAANVQGYEAVYSHDYWNTTDGVGNYWHDWANNNNTNDNDGDGIVDWPYKLDGDTGAEDYYPLTNSPPIPELSSLLIGVIVVAFIVGVLTKHKKP